MAMFCPQCNKVFEQQAQCGDCNIRTLYYAQNLLGPAAVIPDEEQWQQTPWGRIIFGVILTQGLCFGLQFLLSSFFLAAGDESNGTWQTLWGIAALHALQALCLLVGGALTAAGHPRAVLYGSIVGLTNGIIFLFLQRGSAEQTFGMVVYALPVIHLVLGGLGGLIGRYIWQPAPSLPSTETSPTNSADSPSVPEFWGTLWTGPVHLGRVFAGIFLVIVGVVWSNTILDFVLRSSNGTLNLTSHLQAQLVGWEISALVTLIGAGFAGASATNGFKQGICVGLGSIVLLVGIQMGNPKVTLEVLILNVASVFILTMVGGWFGAQMFPPLVKKRRRLSDLY
jgi:hypothetical protein